MQILFIGDISGSLGRKVVEKALKELEKTYYFDMVIANGENATHGKGISENHFNDLLDLGIDVITLGNHYAAKKEIFDYIDTYENILRPYNLHKSIPGKGSEVYNINGVKVRVTNLLGRVFINMESSNPFDALEEIIKNDDSDIHIVDFHAEATGEKYSLAYAFDGKVSAVLGTHTHIQTRDAHILPNGTIIMSDVGMCGAYDSILGVNPSDVVKKSWTGIPTPFNVKEDGRGIFSGVILTFNDQTFKCEKIEPIYQIIDECEL